MAKQLAKVTQGRVKDCDVTWFPELVDKRMLQEDAIYVHFAMCSVLY